MAVLDLGTLKIEVQVLNDDAHKQLDTTEKKVQSSAEKIKAVADNLVSTGTQLTKFVTLPILAAAAASVKLATDMAETASKIGVVFGDNAAAIEQWASKSITNMGLARQTAMDAVAVYGDMGKGMGLTTDATLEMSTAMVQLAADLASFKNISVDRALVALNGVYTGETEALKGLGIVMTQANLQQFALNQGITKQITEMTQAELVTLRYQYVMGVTADAQGDFVRTGGGVANQMRMVTENLKELGTQAGEVLLPMVNKAVVALNNMLQTLQQLTPEQREAVVVTGLVVAGIGPLLVGVGKAVQAYQTLKTSIAAANAAGQVSAGPVGWIALAATAIVTLATVIVTQAVAAYKELHEASIKLEESTKSALTAVQDSGATFAATRSETRAAAAAAEEYLQRLDELNGVAHLTVAQQAEYRNIVNTLNGLIPDLNLQISEQTGKLTEGTGAIREQIVAWKDLAIAEAMQEHLSEITSQYVELLIAQATAEQDLADIQAERAEAEKRRVAIAEELYKITGKTTDELYSWGGSGLAMNYERLTGKARELWQEYNTLEKTVLDCDEKVKRMSETMLANEDAIAAVAETMGKTEAAVHAMMQRVAEGTATQEEIDELAGAFDELGEAVEDVDDIMASFTATAQNMFERLEKEEKQSVDQMIRNLQKNQQDLANWASNLETLGQRVANEGFMDYIRSMGPEYANMVQAMVDATPEKLHELVMAWQSGASTARAAAESLGYNIAAGVAAGISSGESVVSRSMGDLMDRVIAASKKNMMIKSPSKRTEAELGEPFGAGIGVGIERSMDGIAARLNKRLNGIISGASAQSKRTAAAHPVSSAPAVVPLSGGITQNVSITSPVPLSPSQTARENRNALRRLIWDAV